MSRQGTERHGAQSRLYEAFREVRPQILGALLDAVAVALHRLPSIKLPGLPRMADFALWATATETAFGWPSGTFMAAYEGNRESANEVALEASVVARPLLELLEAQGEWTGSSSELLKLLEERLGDQVRRLSGWPKNPRSLSGHLKRLAPNMRAAGWALEQDRSSKKRSWMIRRQTNDATPGAAIQPSSAASQDGGCEATPSDADWFGPNHDDGNDADDAAAGECWNPDRF
jgi:hypothetical protein